MNSRPPAAARTAYVCTVLLSLLLLLTACASGRTTDTEPRVPPPQHAPAAAGPMSRADVDAWLDGRLPDALDRTGIAGATVSVVHDGKILTARGYGQADLGAADRAPQPVDPARTMFRIGSVSKVVTATAVLQLVEQNRIDLDAPVDTYLDFSVPQPRGQVTVRHLLTHTAGFEERAQHLIQFGDTAMDLRDHLATEPPEQVYAPGTTPAYSNYGNALAGYLVQRVSGQPFAEYVEQHLLLRAQMTSSSFAQPLPERLAPQMARGYPDNTQAEIPYEMVAAAPAGALATTATDMGAFMVAQLGEAPAGRALLRPETLALMQQPGLDADTLGAFAAGPRMTLGWFDASRNGHRILGHQGDTTVFHADLELYPEDRTGIFVAVNSSGRSAADAHELRGALMREFADRYFPGTSASATAPVGTAPVTAATDAAAVAGTYQSSRSLYSTFGSLLRLSGQTHVAARDDGTLLMSPGPDTFRPAVYAEIAPAVWREVGGQRVITVREVEGGVDAIGYGSAGTLLRVDFAHQAGWVVPVVSGALLILLVAAAAWPARTVLRRHYGSTPRLPERRAVLVLRRVGIGAALAAALGWALILLSLMASRDLTDAPIRIVQVLQAVGALAVIPAALTAVASVRRRARRSDIAVDVLVLTALTVLAWFAVAYHLIAPSISY